MKEKLKYDVGDLVRLRIFDVIYMFKTQEQLIEFKLGYSIPHMHELGNYRSDQIMVLGINGESSDKNYCVLILHLNSGKMGWVWDSSWCSRFTKIDTI